MEIRAFCVFAIICASISAIYSKKYDRISDCYFHNMGLVYGGDSLTFICGQENGEDTVFVDKSKFHCSNNEMDLSNIWPGVVNFENCKFHQIQRNYMDIFPLLRTLNISDVDLSIFPSGMLPSARNLSRLFASQNQLNVIPDLAFANSNKLRLIDFSKNAIKKVGSLAFVGASSLESLDLSQNDLLEFGELVMKPLSNLRSLNLSHNRIQEFDLQFLNAPNLLALDLSHNNLTALKEHSFDNITNLSILHLAFNPIGNLKIDTFAFLLNLQELNLKHTNITNIELGTFSHQHNLVSLDLSENALKKLDFMLFFPILHDLRSLHLGENQLSHLDGFRNSLFPKLNLLDIKNNMFNCSYLQYFMKNINWEHLRIVLDPKSVNPREPNIRGIKCKQTGPNDYFNEPDSNHKSNENSALIHMTLIFMCIIMMVFLIIFVVMNRDKIYTQFKRFTIPYRQNESSNLEYSNENY